MIIRPVLFQYLQQCQIPTIGQYATLNNWQLQRTSFYQAVRDPNSEHLSLIRSQWKSCQQSYEVKRIKKTERVTAM